MTGNRLLLWHGLSSCEMETRVAAAGYVAEDGTADRLAYAISLIYAMHNAFDQAEAGDTRALRVIEMSHIATAGR